MVYVNRYFNPDYLNLIPEYRTFKIGGIEFNKYQVGTISLLIQVIIEDLHNNFQPLYLNINYCFIIY